jgi:hypothetical protein
MRLISKDNIGAAKFEMSTDSERFRSMCDGHVMAGIPFVPASFYYEVVVRAVLATQDDLECKTWIPSVQNLL